MCEIAVLDPEQASIEITQQLARRFHEEQGDGLGVLTIHNEGDSFDYNIYKSTDPHWQTVYTFLKRNYDDAWRIVVHGRAMTSGKRNWHTSHPIEINCDKCDFDYVIHNGSVKKHEEKRGGLVTAGHNFNTKVDTEVIAHTIGSLPESVKGFTTATYNLKGNLHYLLFTDEGILCRSGPKYDLSDEFTMTCSYRDFDEPKELGFTRGRNRRWCLVTPDEEEPEIEIEESYVRTSTTTSANTTTARTATSNTQDDTTRGAWEYYTDQVENEKTEQNTSASVKITYTDHADYDNVSALKVAPGVMRLIEHDMDETEYIFRDREPELYFHYAPESPPENLDQLAKIAENDQRGWEEDPEQAALTELFFEGEGQSEDVVGEALYEEVATTVAGGVDEITVADMAEIKDDVIEAAFDGVSAAEAANEKGS